MRAQHALVNASEVRLAKLDQKAVEISAVRRQLDSLTEASAGTEPGRLPSLLRALAKTERTLEQALDKAQQERRLLLDAKTREKPLLLRQDQLVKELERRAEMEAVLESSIAMIRKASRKRDVLT